MMTELPRDIVPPWSGDALEARTASGAWVPVTVTEVRRCDGEFYVTLEGKRTPLYFHQHGQAWRWPSRGR